MPIDTEETPVRRKRKTKKRRSTPAATTAAPANEEAPERPSKRRPAKKAAAAKRPAKKAPAARKAAPVAKKATGATKAVRKAVAPVERPVENPFRPGSNSYHYVEALKKGGKRSTIVRQLLRKISVQPWDGTECADPFTEVDKRLTMVVKSLETKFGWAVERRGRGSESYVKITPPGTARAAKATKATKKARKAA